jgi:hypothetical protein
LSKKFKRKLLEIILPPFLFVVLYLIYFTCRKNFHYNKILDKDEVAIFVFWHGELIMLPFAYIRYRKNTNIAPIISEHHDGEVATRLVKLMGARAIRGSSSKGGIKALKGAFKALEEKKDVGITPDGPKGPRHSVADGVVKIAQKKGVRLVSINCKASAYWQFNSWDKSFIPKPFSKLDFYFSDPFSIDDLELERAKEEVKKRLMQHAF